MQIITLYLASAVAFLALDSVMLKTVLQPMFARTLGDALRQPIDLGAAVIFYLMYVAGVVWFAGLPALRDGGVPVALLNGALLGLVAYGTYELTNKAVMRDWTWQMVAADWAWGTVLTALTAGIGVAVTKAFVG